jgi:GrpB-like predicted nucleotidyltransferase (UPF0157 family)
VRIRAAIGERVLRAEHLARMAVAGLVANPVVEEILATSQPAGVR